MANQLYNSARVLRMNGQLNWLSQEFRLFLYAGTPNFVAADATIQAIVTRAVTTKRAVSGAIGGKSVDTEGYVRSDSVVFPLLAPGAQITHMVLAKWDSGGENNSIPIYYIDDAWQLPFLANGLDLPVTPDWTQNRGWFRG